MYLAYWGLREPPFRNAVDRKQFFKSPTHEEALARLAFLVEGHRRCGLLLGPAGTGKSLTLEVLAADAHRSGRAVALLNLQGLDKQEFLSAIAAMWGLDAEPDSSPALLWRMLNDRLLELRIERREALVLLDHADEATEEVHAAVLRLGQTDLGGSPAATLVVAARSDALSQIGPRLLELADLRIDLAPWDAGDARDYLEHNLALAGRSAPVFTDEAAVVAAELAGGIPRQLAQLADLALIAAAGQDLPMIDVHTIESVYAELGVIYQYADAR